MKERSRTIMGGMYKDNIGQKFRVMENHRFTEWVIWSNHPAQLRSSQTTWHKIVSRRVLNTFSEKDSTSSMGNLCQCAWLRTQERSSPSDLSNFLLISSHITLLISWESIPRSVREAKPPTLLPSDSELDFTSVKFALFFHYFYIISVHFVFSPMSLRKYLRPKLISVN